VSVGGFGYSSGQAGTRDKPWLQGFGLIDRTLEYPTLILPEPERKPVILNNVKKDEAPKVSLEDSEPVDQEIALENANVN